ncbi:MAG TPA: hypothetical protein VN174_00375 [Candidatus Methanoperedens sp.]|nr:hypothetical protein [Candidatus Methanoperedens sp.]
MKNTIIGLILGLIIAMWAFYLYTQKPKITTSLPPATPTTAEISEIPENVISDDDLIRQALADKYNKDLSDVTYTSSQNDGTHASGGVKFSGDIAGAWVLAAKDDGVWKIVQDGNGVIMCEIVAPYDFPVSMVAECVDKNGKLIKY